MSTRILMNLREKRLAKIERLKDKLDIVEKVDITHVDEIKPRDYKKGCVFYIIQVIPDVNRYKFGFSTNVKRRCEDYSALAPDCVVVRKYQCHPHNEYLLLDIVRNFRGVCMVSREAADVVDVKQLVSYFDIISKANDLTKKINEVHDIVKNIASYRCKIESSKT